jgi:hypothetical protein
MSSLPHGLALINPKNHLDTAAVHPYIARIVVAHSSNPSSRGSAPSPLTETPDPPPSPVLDLTDAAAARIIRELAEPNASLDSVAAANGIAVADLALWLTTPGARERMLAIEQRRLRPRPHGRLPQTLKAVTALLRVLDTFNALAASRPADDPLVIRAAIHANKAAYHLYRLSRILPIDETQRARANEGIRAARTIATQVSNSPPTQPPPQPPPQAPDPDPAPAQLQHPRPLLAPSSPITPRRLPSPQLKRRLSQRSPHRRRRA